MKHIKLFESTNLDTNIHSTDSDYIEVIRMVMSDDPFDFYLAQEEIYAYSESSLKKFGELFISAINGLSSSEGKNAYSLLSLVSRLNLLYQLNNPLFRPHRFLQKAAGISFFEIYEASSLNINFRTNKFLIEVPDGAFRDLPNLEHLEISVIRGSDDIRVEIELGDSTFVGTNNLKHIRILRCHTKIEGSPFKNLPDLGSIEIESIQRGQPIPVSEEAFRGCEGLINLGISLTSIPNNIFRGLTNLRSLNIYGYYTIRLHLSREVFKDLKKLNLLSLEHFIFTFDEDTFVDLAELKTLSIDTDDYASEDQKKILSQLQDGAKIEHFLPF